MWNSMEDGFGKNRFDQNSGATGGFLNTTVSSPSTVEKRKNEKLTNVIPCTIAQIRQIPESEENLKVGSVTAKIVTFVGLVQSVDVQSTKVSYVIDDLTGPGLEVQIWIGENEDLGKKISSIHENTYVRVTGAVRSLKGKRHVIAFKITPVKDANEISMHILEVIHTSMSITLMDQNNTSTMGTSNNFATPSLLPSIASSATDSHIASMGFSSRLTPQQKMVLQSISTCKDEQGISIQELMRNLKSLQRVSIQEALDFLSNEGHIYSTIDEDHFKSTDSV